MCVGYASSLNYISGDSNKVQPRYAHMIMLSFIGRNASL